MKKVLSLALASLGGLSLLGGALLLAQEKPTEVLAEGTGTSSYEWTEEIGDDEIYLVLDYWGTVSEAKFYAHFWRDGATTTWPGVEAKSVDAATNLYKVDGYDSASTHIILSEWENGYENVNNTWGWYKTNVLPGGGWDIYVQTSWNSFNGYKSDCFVYREILVESPVQPNLHYWTQLTEYDAYDTTWPGIQMEKVEDAYEYDLPEGYDLYRAVVRYVEGYETQGLIINSNGGQTNTFSDWSSAPGYVFRYDGETGLTWDDSATKRSAYEFLPDWRTLRKEHEGKADSICWLLEDEAKLGKVIDSYEGVSSYLSGVTDIDGVTIGETVDYLRTLSGGTTPGGEAFRPFSGGKEEGTLYLLGGALLLGLFAAGGYFIYRKKARRGL